MIKILIVSFTLKEKYYDGFYSALNILKNKYMVDFWKINFDKKKRNFNDYHLVLFKGNFGINNANNVNFVKNDKIKVGLIISSTNKPSESELQYYDILFYETDWYYNNTPLLKNHKNCYRAFGVDTNIMRNLNKKDKEYDVLSIGTFASYKRQHLICNFEGKKIIYGNKYNQHNSIANDLEKKGIIIKDAIHYHELVHVYNNSKVCYIPCNVNGGGERAVLEARACGLKVVVENDNPKLQELCFSKIYSHIDYAESLENGIKKLFNIDDMHKKNHWFIAIKKYDNQLYNFHNYDKIFYKDLYVDDSLETVSYIADPFIIKHKTTNYLFLEYKNKSNKGVLGCIDLTNKPNHIKTILDKPYHLSYPNIFLLNGKYYMIPESHSSKRLELYKSSDFPYKWDLEHCMIENINLSDTTLFIHDGIYWLFTTENIVNNKLTIFFSDNLFSKKWTRHPFSGNSGCRCAGNIFIKNNKIYRPAQDCTKGYGYSIIIYEITSLGKDKYSEIIVNNIEPNWFPNIYGTHTLNFNEDYIVWDGKFKCIEI